MTIDPEIETRLPSPELCALMAYNLLKDGESSDKALAWAELGSLLTSLPRKPIHSYKVEIAVDVAKAAEAVAVTNNQINRWNLQQALLRWIESE